MPQPAPSISSLSKDDRAHIETFRAFRHTLALTILTRPELKLTEIAALLNVPQSRVYNLHASDDFRAYMHDLAEKHSLAVLGTHADKLNMMADLALEKSIERIRSGCSENFLTQARQDALASKGFENGLPQPGAQQIHISINANTLIEARQAVISQRSGTTQRKLPHEADSKVLSSKARAASLGSNSGTVPIGSSEDGPPALDGWEDLGVD